MVNTGQNQQWVRLGELVLPKDHAGLPDGAKLAAAMHAMLARMQAYALAHPAPKDPLQYL